LYWANNFTIGGYSMSLIADLLERPFDQAITSKYTAMNGLIYLGAGAMVLIWPGMVQTIFRDAAFVGNEAALIRVVGMTVMVIGWLYLFGGLSAGTFEEAIDAHARGDYAKALRLIRPLANNGDASSQFNLGLMYMTGQGVQQDDAAAALWFRKAAEQGLALAQSDLGVLYRDGRGVTRDFTEATMWFRKAADQGDPVAEFLLGNQYANGIGVPLDYREAMIWFRKAAEQGHAVAKLYLGVMYAEGRGVPQDYVLAHMWFSLAAAQGEKRAVQTLAMAEQRMTPVQIAEAQKLARDWKPVTQPSPR
jgi:TPR repeat protein